MGKSEDCFIYSKTNEEKIRNTSQTSGTKVKKEEKEEEENCGERKGE